MKLKKILACAMAGAMVLGSLSLVSADTVTESTDYSGGQLIDGSTGWNTTDGDDYLISDNPVAVVFENTPFIRDSNNWSNFVFETVSSDSADGISLRADAYGWTYGSGVNTPSYTVETSWGDAWDDFATYSKEDITIVAQKTSDDTVKFGIAFGELASEWYTVTYPDGVPDDLYFHVGADGGSINVLSVTYGYTLDDLTADSWCSAFTNPIDVVDGYQLVITGTTTNNGTLNWENAVYILYSGGGVDVDWSNYNEYFVGRLDDYGWGTASYEVTSYPDDWDAWLAATQAGAEFTITVTYDAGVIEIVSSCEGAEYVASYTVEDSSLGYTIALSGENCTLTNLTYNYYDLLVLDDDTSEDESSEDTSDSGTSDEGVSSTEESNSSEETSSGSEESSSTEEASTTKDSATTVTGTSVDNVICGTETAEDGTTSTWWINHSAAILLENDSTTTITFTNTTTGSSNWNSGIYVLYTADEVFAGGDGISSTEGYKEYYVCRSDLYAWNSVTNTASETFTDDTGIYFSTVPEDTSTIDWETWLAACQSGQECTIIAVMEKNVVTITFKVGDIQSVSTIPVNTDLPVYLSLTGELCELTNISYTVSKTISAASGATSEFLTSSSDSDVYVYEVTVVETTAEDYLTVVVKDDAGNKIVANSNGTCTYEYSDGELLFVDIDIAEGGAITLEEGATYTINVDRDGNTFLITYWSSNGELLLSYLIEDTDIAETSTSYLRAEGDGTYTVIASVEDATGSIVTTSPSSEGESESETGKESESESESEEDTSTEDDGDNTTSTSKKPTSDASAAAPIVIALLGCAVVAFASKKKLA